MLLDTPVCDFGWVAPDFVLKTPEGVSHRMSEHLGKKGLLIAFICNHCPYVQAIGHRLAADARTLIDEGIGVLAVMSNDYLSVPEDAPAIMTKFSQHFDFPFPYLVDHDQKVGKDYGAVCTPDFFGLNGEGKLQYRGRLDSLGMSQDAERHLELVEAMRLIARTGKGPEQQNPSMGCSIKWR